MSYQVYIIENHSGKIYIGLSEDPHKRLIDHNNGVSKWTAKFTPWKLVWLSYEQTLGDVRKLENKMKRQKGGAGLQTLRREFGEEQSGSSSGS
mgnify:CR=1 FL=1